MLYNLDKLMIIVSNRVIFQDFAMDSTREIYTQRKS